MSLIPLKIMTDYSLLQSLIKIEDLFKYAKEHNLNTLGIVDTNLNSSIEFYFKCQKHKIKPIIGLEINIGNNNIYLYAKNYDGYQNLLKLSNILNEREITLTDLNLYHFNLLAVVPYKSKEIFNEIADITDTFVGYDETNKKEALLLSKKIVYVTEVRCLDINDVTYLKYLISIGNLELQETDEKCYLRIPPKEDIKTTIEFSDLIEIVFPEKKLNIPKYKCSLEDTYEYLMILSKKGLQKRLDGNIPENYRNRLVYELEVIKNMGFVDYILIVYDYVLYAKKNNIFVSPGRGSAAGSLVCFSLGITEVDPIKYDLLFERFLNPERITMPDIDIDFEDLRRDEVKEYLKEKYGTDYVASVLAYGTLGSRMVIRDVGKLLGFDEKTLKYINKEINPKLSLKQNYYSNKNLVNLLNRSNEFKKLFKISSKLEGLKRHTTTHAAGVVISSVPLIDVMPIVKTNEGYLTGTTMEYLEDLGMLKMDLLALRNLTLLHNILDKIPNLKISNIPLDDQKTFEIFQIANTNGVFQFESSGMKNTLRKFKPNSFASLYALLALYRPGPMNNIDTYIKRKEGKEKPEYFTEKLKPILESTYGIIIYQEQIIQILTTLGSYSYAESDIIRRAISKKKLDVINNEKNKFITRGLKNNYSEELLTKIFDLIVKFANYGFNKSHSVSYALISYYLAYLKTYYSEEFMLCLLNMSISSDSKKDYINEARNNKINILLPDINHSSLEFTLEDNNIRMPLNVIKNISSNVVTNIINNKGDGYNNIFDFVIKNKELNVQVLKSLILAGCFDSFGMTRRTIIENLERIQVYADLAANLDNNLIEKPVIEDFEEYSKSKLMNEEIEFYGFYISKHPASFYQDNKIIKINNIENFFNKSIITIVLVEKINKILTKKNEEMAFITGSDETGKLDYIIFKDHINILNKIKVSDLVKIIGKVERRSYKYEIIINSVEILENGSEQDG